MQPMQKESAAASEEMNAQAEQLKAYVGDLVMLITGKRNQAKKSSTHQKGRVGSGCC